VFSRESGWPGLIPSHFRCKLITMSTLAVETEAEIWNRTIKPDQGDLSPDAARAFLMLKLPPADIERVNALSAKASEDALTAVESAQLDNYLNVGRTLELLKAKARFSLLSTPFHKCTNVIRTCANAVSQAEVPEGRHASSPGQARHERRPG
jgi:hypothetical protein